MASHEPVALSGPVTPGQARRTLALADELLTDETISEIVCELSGTIDLSVVDALARLQLTARRRGVQLRVRVNSTEAELKALLCYLGLAGAIAKDL